jgi:head-tail adaptor
MPRSLMNRGAASAGQRDIQITIERVVQGTGDSGFPQERPGAAMQAWAKREYVTLTERNQAGQLTASSVIRWEIPYMADMDPDLVPVPKERWIVYQNRRYDIQAAEVLPRNHGKAIILTTLVRTD